MDAGIIVSPEVARTMTELSLDIGRQVGLLIDRVGKVYALVVGDSKSLFLPDLPRRDLDRLSGLRLVHTHLNHEALNDDDLTDLALLRLDLVAAIETLENGLPGKVYIAHLLPANDSDSPWVCLPPTPVHDLEDDFNSMIDALEEEFARMRVPKKAGDNRDRAILVHVSMQPLSVADDSMLEMRELARSAGLHAVAEVSQRRKPDPKYVMGKGKLQSVIIKAMQLGAEIIVLDLDLSPSQVKSLSDMTDLKILDRTQLILDIFAQHAVTREGKLQVELAQLKYLLPLLSIRQTALSRLTGGIGGRGPGETRLEIDRRRARDRVAQLEREVRKLGQRRELRRGQRSRKNVPIVSIVGYANAGKSTLLNQLTNSDVIAEDKLFATLNPVSRRLRFPQEREVVITDTVGFIRNLPKDLLAAFRTTFEEVREADMLLHVIDASCDDFDDKFNTVCGLLRDLELDEKPTMLVLNKMDKCEPERLEGLASMYKGIPISALDKGSMQAMLENMEQVLWEETHSTAIHS